MKHIEQDHFKQFAFGAILSFIQNAPIEEVEKLMERLNVRRRN